MKYILSLLIIFYSTISLGFYIRLEAGSSIARKYSMDKSVAAGYYFGNTYRADLMFGGVSLNSTNYISHNESVDDSTTMGAKRIKYNTDIKYFLFNNYFNVIKREDYNVFLVGGIGYARIKEKVHALFSGIIMNGEVITVPLSVDKFQTKKTNFIYSIGAGAGIKINSVIHLDLSYNYRDFGRPKADPNIKEIGQVKHYDTHQVSIGIRLDI